MSWYKSWIKSNCWDMLLAIAVFMLSMWLGWCLSLAYPEGIVNEETPSYWIIQQNFQFFAPNTFDWVRTIPYGALLYLSSQFENPTNFLYWTNTLIFSLAISAIFILGRSLNLPTVGALLLALSTQLFEFACMRIYFINLQVCPDPIFC